MEGNALYSDLHNGQLNTIADRKLLPDPSYAKTHNNVHGIRNADHYNAILKPQIDDLLVGGLIDYITALKLGVAGAGATAFGPPPFSQIGGLAALGGAGYMGYRGTKQWGNALALGDIQDNAMARARSGNLDPFGEYPQSPFRKIK